MRRFVQIISDLVYAGVKMYCWERRLAPDAVTEITITPAPHLGPSAWVVSGHHEET